MHGPSGVSTVQSLNLLKRQAGAFLVVLVVSFAAVVEGVVFAVERQHAVDATAVFIPSRVALGLEDDPLPFPLVEIFRGGQGSGANALTGVENIQSIVRAIAGGGGIDATLRNME